MRILISTEKEKLDLDFIHEFLTRAYWAQGRTKKEVQTSIDHSLNFGVYLDGKQIGFARMLTDYVVFGYLMDVFIIEEHQGKGYAKQLIKTIMEHPDLLQIKRWMLATHDAHELYKQFGFKEIEHPSRWMGKLT